MFESPPRALGYADWGQVIFGRPLLARHRIRVARAHAEGSGTRRRASPDALGTQLAPAPAGAVAYLSVTQGPPDVFALALIGYGDLRQYCARTVYDKKPSAGQNDGVLEHKAASTGEIGEAVLCIAESRHPSFRRRHEEGESDEWCKERQDCSGKSQAHRHKARQHQESDDQLNSPESV